MTNTRHRNADVIIAFAEGRKIQTSFRGSEWRDFTYDPAALFAPWHCHSDYEWRIKPEKKTGWVNIYPKECNRYEDEFADKVIGNTGGIYATREMADYANGNNSYLVSRVACIEIEYEPGEGL